MHALPHRSMIDSIMEASMRIAGPRLARRLSACGLALALLAGSGPAAAWLRRPDPMDLPAVQALRIVPRAMPGEAGPAEVFGLLTMPAQWDAGDAAVVLVGARFPAGPLQQRLVDTLLAEGAAVLELDTDAARGASADSGVAPAPQAPPDLLPDLFGALVALRQEIGAGIAVVIGLEQTGEAALLAAAPEEARQRLPGGATGYAAAMALGPGAARFRAGTPPAAAEGWEGRVPLLCEALAWSVPENGVTGQGFAARCTAALAGTPALAGLPMGMRRDGR